MLGHHVAARIFCRAISNLLVVDIDHDDALIRAMWDREQWRPNAVVVNPTIGHALAVWALEAPFARTVLTSYTPTTAKS